MADSALPIRLDAQRRALVAVGQSTQPSDAQEELLAIDPWHTYTVTFVPAPPATQPAGENQ